jgi:hypothetical protein
MCNNIIFAHALTWESRFDTVDPTRFRVGDIVEVQATVVAVPIRNNRFKMILQLGMCSGIPRVGFSLTVPEPVDTVTRNG